MFSSREFFPACLLFFFSAGSVLGTGLVKTHSCGSGSGVIILASRTKPSPALLAGTEAVQGPEPPVSVEGGWAGILTRCWWEWKLEPPFGKAVWQNVPRGWELFEVGFLHNDLEKVGENPKRAMKRSGSGNCGTVAYPLDGIEVAIKSDHPEACGHLEISAWHNLK